MMSRALRIAKVIGSLLIIELFVPGGTLIILAMLLSGRPDSPLVGLLGRRVPALLRVLPR
jgi:hypothetical protein